MSNEMDISKYLVWFVPSKTDTDHNAIELLKQKIEMQKRKEGRQR